MASKTKLHFQNLLMYLKRNPMVTITDASIFTCFPRPEAEQDRKVNLQGSKGSQKEVGPGSLVQGVSHCGGLQKPGSHLTWTWYLNLQ